VPAYGPAGSARLRDTGQARNGRLARAGRHGARGFGRQALRHRAGLGGRSFGLKPIFTGAAANARAGEGLGWAGPAITL
jgi:hypothetical protein